MLDFVMRWWERRKAFRELAQIQRSEEDSLMQNESNLFNRAIVALSIGDSAEALRCWRRACNQYPNLVQARHESLTILLGLGLYEEAEQHITAGLKRYPRDPYFAEGLAQITHRRHNLSDAALRWDQIRKKFPNRWMAYVYGSTALRELSRVDEAARVMARAVARLPSDVPCRIEFARVAEASENWKLALERWNFVDYEFQHVTGAIGAARALTRLGRPDEARERLLSQAHQYGANDEFRQAIAELMDDVNEQRAHNGSGAI
jgi:tetratricopeptide (TPR) repeat protein